MPRIKPFCGIYPSQEYVERVIASPPILPLSDAVVATLPDHPFSFLHLVEPPLENRFLQGPREALICRQAAENLQQFLDKRILVRDETPCIYLYTADTGGETKTGVWAVTHFDDYVTNHVRKHENTRAERQRGIAEYLRLTGIDANPVLIAYRGLEEVDELIARYLATNAFLSFERNGASYRLHRVSASQDIEKLIRYFGSLPAAYLADGHHRAAALSSYGAERRRSNPQHTGLEEYNYFSSIYFAGDLLVMKGFARLVKDLNGLDISDFLDRLRSDFEIHPEPDSPDSQPGKFGMYLPGHWYSLLPKTRSAPVACNGTPADPVQELDVTCLQQLILGPLLGIEDPRTNERIRFAGGDVSDHTLAREVDRGDAAVLFTLCPPSVRQLMAVADAGLVMPPKSTWFEPKLDLGILTHLID